MDVLLITGLYASLSAPVRVRRLDTSFPESAFPSPLSEVQRKGTGGYRVFRFATLPAPTRHATARPRALGWESIRVCEDGQIGKRHVPLGRSLGPEIPSVSGGVEAGRDDRNRNLPAIDTQPFASRVRVHRARRPSHQLRGVRLIMQPQLALCPSRHLTLGLRLVENSDHSAFADQLIPFPGLIHKAASKPSDAFAPEPSGKKTSQDAGREHAHGEYIVVSGGARELAIPMDRIEVARGTCVPDEHRPFYPVDNHRSPFIANHHSGGG
jgi:hypothetical protein